MTANTEVLDDPSLPDLPTGYEIRRCIDGILEGRMFLAPTGASISWTVDTPGNRLLLVLEAWNRYSDVRNAAAPSGLRPTG